jgi:uncharacterized protein (DUF983 family)
VKCPKCGHKNLAVATLCEACGIVISGRVAGDMRRVLRFWVVGGLTGLGTALSFNLVHDVLTYDQRLAIWEFALAVAAPSAIVVGLARVTRSPIAKLLAIAYLTLLVPVLGASFGASGSEPLWQFAALGLAGGLAWSTPIVLWQLVRVGQQPK